MRYVDASHRAPEPAPRREIWLPFAHDRRDAMALVWRGFRSLPVAPLDASTSQQELSMTVRAFVPVAILGVFLLAGRADAAPQSVQPSGVPASPTAASDTPAHPSVTLPSELARVLTDYEEAWTRRDAA